jgi:polyhydroxybutyrate depolymerase
VGDVGFIGALIDELQKTLRIDPKRIYVTGMSNGGMMAHRLAYELSDKIAAIAPVAGNFNEKAYNADTYPKDPVSVIIFHGTKDKVVPYSGGLSFTPVSHAVEFWVKHNDRALLPQREEEGHVIRETYTGCRKGTEVTLYTIEGGGHVWPGSAILAQTSASEPSHEISATDIMWDFFLSHPKE